MYHAVYPNRQQPSKRMFNKIHERLREIGQFKPNLVDCGRSRLVRSPTFEENIFRTIEENPGTSCRRIALQERSSYHTVWNILHNQLLTLSDQHVQALLPIDLQQRIIFGFFIDAIKIHNFCAIFCLLMRHPSSGMGSITFITYIWGDENPHAIIASRHQHRFSMNVWADIFRDHLIGSYILPNRLTG